MKIAVVVILILLIVWLIHSSCLESFPKQAFYKGVPSNAVILVPGLGGSILEAKWDLSFEWKRFYCQRREDRWTQIWPSAFSAVPIENECWKRLIKVNSNFENTKGVEVRAKDWGGLRGINILDQVDLYLLNIPIVKYFYETSKRLGALGYRVYGAPYDFRRILEPNVLRTFIIKLRALVEECGGGKGVTLISHSLGGPVTSYFLNSQSKSWRDNHISKFIGVSAPMGGATQSLKACLTGDTEGIPVTKAFMRSIEKKYAGILWMINEPETWKNIPLINGDGSDAIPHFLESAGQENSAHLWDTYIRSIWRQTVENPEVETYLVHGSNVKTLVSLNYPKKRSGSYRFNRPHDTYEHKGDGTVPGISLAPLTDWKVKKQISLPGATHLGILNDRRWLNLIAKLL